jgi:hypothetical protein
MGMVVHNAEKARTTWGRDYMEKAIFMNSTIPVIEEFQLNPVKVFEYFNLDIPTAPLITRRISFPILLDIRMHLGTAMMCEPDRFGSKQTKRNSSTGCSAVTPERRRGNGDDGFGSSDALRNFLRGEAAVTEFTPAVRFARHRRCCRTSSARATAIPADRSSSRSTARASATCATSSKRCGRSRTNTWI